MFQNSLPNIVHGKLSGSDKIMKNDKTRTRNKKKNFFFRYNRPNHSDGLSGGHEGGDLSKQHETHAAIPRATSRRAL